MEKKTVIQELMDVDVEFCNQCQITGAEGWIQYFEDQSIMVTSGLNKDLDDKHEIYYAMEKLFSLDNISFRWAPLYCDVSDDFTMGFTSGKYERNYYLGNVKVEEKGKYVTIWKKIDDKWKIVLDMGN